MGKGVWGTGWGCGLIEVEGAEGIEWGEEGGGFSGVEAGAGYTGLAAG